VSRQSSVVSRQSSVVSRQPSAVSREKLPVKLIPNSKFKIQNGKRETGNGKPETASSHSLTNSGFRNRIIDLFYFIKDLNKFMVRAAGFHGFGECSVLFDQQSVDGNELHRLNMLCHWQGVRVMKQNSYLFRLNPDFAGSEP
jgi:hypothetical protein